ncbi:transposase-like zinc-binding domain-containing protein [Hymenobacter setariae]
MCERCSSERVRKNGSNSGWAKYQCTDCGYARLQSRASPTNRSRSTLNRRSPCVRHLACATRPLAAPSAGTSLVQQC